MNLNKWLQWNKRLAYTVLTALLLVSCSQIDITGEEHGSASDGYGSFSVAVPQVLTTRSTADGDGGGIHADRCRLQIWRDGSLLTDRTVSVNHFRAEFSSVYLRDADDALFLFWADNSEGNFYDTDTLTKVKLRGPYVGCNDARDAFCRALTGAEVKAMADELIMLQRPFGQLNIITMDMEELFNRLPAENKSLFDLFVPDEVSVSFSMPSVFDVSTGHASEDVMVNYHSKMYSRLNSSFGALSTLSMDYVFAEGEEQSLNDIEVIFSAPGINPIRRVYSNVPLKRNWRTNVMGALLTGNTKATVTLSDDWAGECERGF